MNARGRDISAIMRKVRSRDTTPEVVFRRALWARGLRYRTCRAPLAGKPDIVLSRARLVIFVDGDFWHGGQWRKRHLAALEDQFVTTPTREYWLAKIRRNMQRDCVATASLMNGGWRVLRFWESQVLHELDDCVELALKAAREQASYDPLSVLPGKTFTEFPDADRLIGPMLEPEGWVKAGSEASPVSLAAASFRNAAPVGFWAALRSLRNRPPLLLLLDAEAPACAPARNLGYSVRALPGAGVSIGSACGDADVELPRPPPDIEPVQWVARYFLNPLVSDLMRGRLLGKRTDC